MWILSFVPHEYKLLKLGTRYNNNKPRDPVTWRAGDSENYKQGIEKLGAIHHNGMENFPLFGVAVVSLHLLATRWTPLILTSAIHCSSPEM